MKWHDSESLMKMLPKMIDGTSPLIGNICPDCHYSSVHLYVHVWDDDYDRASFWLWCDQCKAFVHGVTKVPKEFFNCDALDPDELDIPPEYINAHRKEIDNNNSNIKIKP